MAKNEKLQKNRLIFFYKSPITVALLSIFTFNLYSLYWSYKHWKTIQDSRGKEPANTNWWTWGGKLSKNKRTYPLLAAIIQLFSIYPLFKLIKITAAGSGYERFHKPKLAALCYILASFALYTALSSRPTDDGFKNTAVILAIIFVAVIGSVLYVVQRAANAHNIAILGNRHKFKKWFIGEIVVTIAGILFCILAIDFVLNASQENSYSSELYEVQNRVTRLRSEYDACSSNLRTQHDSIDIHNNSEVNTFNSDLKACENTRLELNQAINEYNRRRGLN